jgi:hypothetical protein
MPVAQIRLPLAALLTVLLAISIATAQSPQKQSAHSSLQSATTTLASLPEADTIIYTSPQRILTEAAPKFMSPIELANMRDDFASMKKNAGIDPASVEYLVMAFRFQKPTGDLSFVPPDVLAVISGDFSADSLLTLGGSFLQDRTRTEKYGSKTLTIMKIDVVEELAQENPLLKSFSELSAVALNANTLAIGNTAYVKAAVDAADGNGRINQTTINSLLRDPNALVSAAGSPLSAFAKSFGLLGTQTTPRESNCNSRFGDFYAAVTMDNSNFNLRGAMNTDNPDTAKIINGLMSGLIQTATSSISDKSFQAGMKSFRLSPKDNELVIEADVPQDLVVEFVKDLMKAKPTTPNTVKKPPVKRRARRKP